MVLALSLLVTFTFVLAICLALFPRACEKTYSIVGECMKTAVQHFLRWLKVLVTEVVAFLYRLTHRLDDWQARVDFVIYVIAPLLAFSGAYLSYHYSYMHFWIPAGVVFALARRHWWLAFVVMACVEAGTALAAGLPFWTWIITSLLTVTFVRVTSETEDGRTWYAAAVFILASLISATLGITATYTSDYLASSIYVSMTPAAFFMGWSISDMLASLTVGMLLRHVDDHLPPPGFA